ncbi:hypothetical protein BU56_00045 [Escherichia coli O145:H25 str. 07-3858]|uniref:hypothetical protein n=1 Tax=Escherichia coli TaxID=562 RepID=UPI0004D7031C|nr:hypothetical protein BU56_00045 [Escherichia coli O145:H25 str. 07-3858]
MASLLIAINQRSPTHLGADVIFTPHLGNFPRGILETITCRLKSGVDPGASRGKCYSRRMPINRWWRLYDKGVPALKNVVGLPFCDIGFAVQGEHLIIVATEDNLLKGAAGTSGTVRQYSFRLCGNAVSYLRVQ